MRTKRLVAGLLSAALLGLAPAAFTASPAQAATPAEVGFDAQITRTKALYNDSFTISGSVRRYVNSATVPVGTVTLLRKLANESSYKTVATDTDGADAFSFTLKAKGNATFVLRYSGGSDGTYDYLPSEASQKQTVYRTLGDKIRGTVLSGKVAPSYKRKPVVIEIKKAGQWRKYATVKTNAKGQWKRKLPAYRKVTHWRAYTPKDKLFAKSFSAYSYRTWLNYR